MVAFCPARGQKMHVLPRSLQSILAVPGEPSLGSKGRFDEPGADIVWSSTFTRVRRPSIRRPYPRAAGNEGKLAAQSSLPRSAGRHHVLVVVLGQDEQVLGQIDILRGPADAIVRMQH